MHCYIDELIVKLFLVVMVFYMKAVCYIIARSEH